jgi:type II secretion system protein N
MMRRIPVRQILKWAGYLVFFIACFIFFAYQTFPYEKLAARIVQGARAKGYDLEIIDLTNAGLTGLTFENMRLVLPEEDDDASPPLDVLFDELTIKTSLFSLFSDSKSYSFDAELAGGEADGDLTIGEDNLEVDAEVQDVELGGIPALRSFTKVPLAGTLNGQLELSMPSELDESTGDVAMTIEGMKVGDGKAQIQIPGWGGLTVDEADAGKLELLATVENGSAIIEKAESDGKDLKVRMLGKIRLGRPIKRSELDLIINAKIEDAYKERSPKVATMFQLASSGLKSAMTPDGAIQYTITGSLGGRLQPRAAGRLPFEAPK